MIQATTTPAAAAATAKPHVSKGPRVPMALKLGAITAEARRQATAILEVLAGARTPTDAAKDLSLSLPAYYKLEGRAVKGLILACRPAGRGPRPSPELEAARLRRQCQRLTQDLQRYQALARTAQRAAGLPAPPSPSKRDDKGRKRRKPAVRALKALAALRQAPEAPAAINTSQQPVASAAAQV
jgi:hypothetical protein